MNNEQVPALRQAVENMATMREAYDNLSQAAEAYNTGKVQLAANITSKGVQASASETLPELAEKVAQIAQTETVIEGGEVMAAQQFGDGALWNLYQVLADMKTRFMGTGDYAALIVCEYYKGYDSLVLQGADGYYTCDGDYYDYASPNHVWHDSGNGKMNRWVAFLYRDEGARLDITNTAISPRSMYIGGHIGTIEYFVAGRLTDLVCGIEDTDVVDNFISGDSTQAFSGTVTIKNIKDAGNGLGFNNSVSDVIIKAKEGSIFTQTTRGVSYSAFSLSNGRNILITGIKEFNYSAGSTQNLVKISGTDAVSIKVIGLEKISGFSFLASFSSERLQMLDFRDLQSSPYPYDRFMFDTSSTAPNLIDIIIGEAIVSLDFRVWNPTSVLADATKKAQLIENIKNHILARVSDRTGLSQLIFTIKTNMYNNIASEQIEWQGETMSLADAFLTKNWLLSGA